MVSGQASRGNGLVHLHQVEPASKMLPHILVLDQEMVLTSGCWLLKKMPNLVAIADRSTEENMNKLKLFTIILFLISSSGCSALGTKQPDSSTLTPVQADSTDITETATSLPSSKLQLTFMEYKSDFTEFFAIDVDCVQNDKLCFSEPTLLFKTMSASSNDPNKPMGLIDSYSWSPEGDEIVLSANKDLFIGDMNTTEWKNITSSPNVEEYDPTWSQDKRYIYYLACTQDDTGMGSCKLARFDLIENTNTLLLDSIEDSIATFSVSPDNQSVVFSVSNGFDRLYRSDLDGSNMHQVAITDLEETSPSFSYDGSLVVFVRTNRPVMVADSKLESDIVVQNSNWDSEKNLTDEFDDEATSPAFSFDGKWIAFDASDEDLQYNIYVVSIDHGVVIQATHGNDDKVFPSWRLFYEQK